MSMKQMQEILATVDRSKDNAEHVDAIKVAIDKMNERLHDLVARLDGLDLQLSEIEEALTEEES